MLASIRLILLLTLFSHVIFGQTAQLMGNVKDLQSRPVSGVSIRLMEGKKGKLSNEQGLFEFQNLASGTYTLQASFVGFKTLVQKIQLEEGKTLSLSLELVVNHIYITLCLRYRLCLRYITTSEVHNTLSCWALL